MIIKDGIKYEDTYGKNLQVTGFINGFQTNKLIIPEEVDGKKVVQITPGAFANQLCIEQVWMPEAIVFIGDFAFENCSNLEKIELTPIIGFKQRTTLTISDSAFSNCWKLGQFICKNRIATLRTKCFKRCMLLNVLDLYIQQVEELSFLDCKSLKKVKFSPSARLGKNCLSGSAIKELSFRGDGIIPESILEFIKKNNLKIRCIPDSNLENLAYLGYHIEIVEKNKI